LFAEWNDLVGHGEQDAVFLDDVLAQQRRISACVLQHTFARRLVARL
jgi:hypothetical protein